MEGGIGILLLLIIVAIVGVVALYLTGGAIFGAKGGGKREPDEARPEHKKVENPENVEFVGTDRKD